MLKGQIEVATKSLNEYKKLMKETAETEENLQANRAVLDRSAAQYMANSSQFLNSQNEKFKNDLIERQKKN